MSAQANIVAFDGAAPPVIHTFQPAGVSQDVKLGIIAEWREMLATVPNVAQLRIVMAFKKLSTGVMRTSVTVQVPVMESILNQNASGYTAAPKVAYVNMAQFIEYNSERSTPAERRLVRQLLINVCGNVPTTVTPILTGAAPELIDNWIIAS